MQNLLHHFFLTKVKELPCRLVNKGTDTIVTKTTLLLHTSVRIKHSSISSFLLASLISFDNNLACNFNSLLKKEREEKGERERKKKRRREKQKEGKKREKERKKERAEIFNLSFTAIHFVKSISQCLQRWFTNFINIISSSQPLFKAFSKTTINVTSFI
uniref:Uncharacterized protein n=1 Tax=Amphimedon queenslandica TaxID=400682 RepID=A0A1X7UB68_AMPQE